MLTGRQIRDARALLGLKRHELAAKTKVLATRTITRAQSVDGEAPITAHQADTIRQALEQAGVVFAADGPRLRESPA